MTHASLQYTSVLDRVYKSCNNMISMTQTFEYCYKYISFKLDTLAYVLQIVTFLILPAKSPLLINNYFYFYNYHSMDINN